MKSFAIVNPRSAGGRTGRDAQAIAKKLSAAFGDVTVTLTDGKMAAARLATQALDRGYGDIIAVGGDGTISETVNGFFRDGRIVNPEASLTIVMSGTGGDFRKSFGIEPGIDAGIAHAARARPRRVDVGRVSFVDHKGAPSVRYFNNIASFGLSGAVVRNVNRGGIAKKIGPLAYKWRSLVTALRWRDQTVRLKIDDVYDAVVPVSTVAVCNGRFFGGGMMIAPHAELDDGLFDVVIMEAVPKGDMLKGLGRIADGSHLQNPRVKVVRGRQVIAAPVDGNHGPVLIELDGEDPGQLPATFDILPKALLLRA